ncbi:MAG: glucokinase [Porticoccaceae bacterium]|jgi:glucokinase
MAGQAWNLVADIGGTNARFSAILEGQLESEFEFHHSVEEYPQFSDLIVKLRAEIIEATGLTGAPKGVCLAVACPADVEHIAFTNSHWQFTKTQLLQWFGCQRLVVINDFEAVAHGITELSDDDCIKIGGGEPVTHKPIGILGAGTGLGMAALVSHSNGYHVLDTEGGHADFAPVDQRQMEVLTNLRKSYKRVSLERVLSGNGIVNIYKAICSIENVAAVFDTPPDVVSAALDGSNPQALTALNTFCESMGAAAGNLALTLGAKGGIYIAGGVIPRFSEFFVNSGFRNKFEDKGRFVSYLQPIPVYLVMRNNLGLLGAAKKLKEI